MYIYKIKLRGRWPIFIKGNDYAWDEQSLVVDTKDVRIAEFRGELVEYICVHKEIK